MPFISLVNSLSALKVTLVALTILGFKSFGSSTPSLVIATPKVPIPSSLILSPKVKVFWISYERDDKQDSTSPGVKAEEAAILLAKTLVGIVIVVFGQA